MLTLVRYDLGPAEPDKQKPSYLSDNISIISHFRNLVCPTADSTEPVCIQTDQVRVLVLVQLLTTLFGEVGWLDPEKLPFVLLQQN